VRSFKLAHDVCVVVGQHGALREVGKLYPRRLYEGNRISVRAVYKSSTMLGHDQ